MRALTNNRLAASLAFISTLALALPAVAQTGVSDDRVSLPDGPGSLEGIGENVDVDPNMGLMSHSVPIRIPPGYQGMTPGVSLNYSSAGGGSVVGMGWSFSFPSIERLTKRGLPEYQPDDEFMASDGGELVHVSGTDPAVYRSRFEGGFVRYTWFDVGTGDEGYWTAEYPNGRIGYFGADSDGVIDEASRVGGPNGTFRYHLVEMTDRYGHEIRYFYQLYGNVTLPLQIGWAHATGSAYYGVTFNYEDREDKLSDCKPGFEELLEHRLKIIHVRANGADILRYELSYEDYAFSGGFTRLSKVQRYGAEGGLHPVEHIFTYSAGLGAECAGAGCAKPYVVQMTGALGVDIAGGHLSLVDINGDALPDAVDATVPGAAHKVFVNVINPDGSHEFAPAFTSTLGAQSSHDPASKYVQALDVDGDGFTDLLNSQTGEVLKNRGTGDWDAIESLWNQGNDGGLAVMLDGDFDVSEGALATVRFTDYDGDKRIDIIRSRFSDTANETTIYRNMGAGAFLTDPGVSAIGAGFDTDNLEFNDMNGDGLLDPVVVLATEVRYRLALGWGQWTSWATVTGFSFTSQDLLDVNLEDLNGDGLADMVIVSGNTVRYWLNRNGTTFDAEQTLTDTQLAVGSPSVPLADQKTVLFADMNGNGSADVVYFDTQGNVSYIELFPERPNLLTRIENALGKVIDVTYSSSVAMQAADGGPGAWKYPLPHAMTVVKTTDQYEPLANVHSQSQYTYHDGYYDGVEKDFRGYERVETFSPGDDTQLDGEAHQIFDVGQTDSYRNGLVLERVDISDGHTISVARHEYTDCAVAEVDQTNLSFPVRFICASHEEVEYQEGLTDASQFVVVASDSTYDGYGNLSWRANRGVVSIGGGACAPCQQTEYTGEPCGDECLGDEAYYSTDYAVPGDNDGAWLLKFPIRSRRYGVADASGAPASDLYTENIFYYDGEAFVGLAYGKLTHGAVTRATNRTDTAGTVIEQARNGYDAHGNLVEQVAVNSTPGGSGHRRWLHDSAGLNVETLELTVGAGSDLYTLESAYTWDGTWRHTVTATELRAVASDGSSTDATRTRWFGYNEFGLPTQLALPGASGAEPSLVMAYEWGSPVSRVVMSQRSTVGGPLDLKYVECRDGYGRVFQTRRQVDAGTWWVSGFKVMGAQGALKRSYPPFVDATGDCDETEPQTTPATYYTDGLGRAIRTVHWPTDALTPAGETILEYFPLGARKLDVEDTRVGGAFEDTPTIQRSNGLGQPLSTERMVDDQTSLAWTVSYSQLGYLISLTEPGGVQRTQTTDLLGRIETTEGADRGLSTYERDAAGHVIRHAGADGEVSRRTTDGFGRVLEQWLESDPDSTAVVYSYDVAGPCGASDCSNTAGHLASVTYRLKDGTHAEDRHGYDENSRLRYFGREVHGHVYETSSQYGHTGRLLSETFPSGLVVSYEYDGAGRLTAIPGYVDAVSYTDHGYASSVELANGVTVDREYDGRDRLTRSFAVDGDQAVLMDLNYTRLLTGHVTEVEDHRLEVDTPMGSARYEYDSLYRMVEAHLDPDRPAFSEMISVEYDDAYRIVSKASDKGSTSPAHVGTYTYGTTDSLPHAVIAAGGVDFAYDAAGRMVARGDTSLTRDARGRVTAVLGAQGQSLASFEHDHQDNRLYMQDAEAMTYYVAPTLRVRNGVSVVSLGIDGTDVVHIYEPSYAAKQLPDLAPSTGADSALAPSPDGVIATGDAWLLHAAGAGILSFATPQPSATSEAILCAVTTRLLDGDADYVRYALTDQLGSLVAVTDEQGDVVSRFENYPYGMERYGDGAASMAHFTGKDRDASTNMIDFGARLLDPWTGRWDAPDPAFSALEFKQGDLREASSGYSYVLGDPINFVDPDGRTGEPVSGAIAGSTLGLLRHVTERKLSGYKVIADGGWKGATWKTTKGGVLGFVTGGVTAVDDLLAITAMLSKDVFGSWEHPEGSIERKTEVKMVGMGGDQITKAGKLFASIFTSAGLDEIAKAAADEVGWATNLLVLERTGDTIAGHISNGLSVAFEELKAADGTPERALTAFHETLKDAKRAVDENWGPTETQRNRHEKRDNRRSRSKKASQRRAANQKKMAARRRAGKPQKK